MESEIPLPKQKSVSFMVSGVGQRDLPSCGVIGDRKENLPASPGQFPGGQRSGQGLRLSACQSAEIERHRRPAGLSCPGVAEQEGPRQGPQGV